jgi:lysophospholipase L1-like esterase
VRRPLILCAGLALISACGGAESPAPERRLGDQGPPATERPTLVAALGDSITAGSPLWDPDPAVRASIGSSADPQSQYEFWAERRLRGVRFRNCGVFGERTDQIAARLDDCARGADVLIVQGGINDIAQMRRVKTAAERLRAMVRRGKELGLRVALVEVLPWNNGYPFAASRIRRLNRMIGAIGRDERVPVFPWYRALEDPGARGRMRRDLTIDRDHPSVSGYRRLADQVRLP